MSKSVELGFGRVAVIDCRGLWEDIDDCHEFWEDVPKDELATRCMFTAPIEFLDVIIEKALTDPTLTVSKRKAREMLARLDAFRAALETITVRGDSEGEDE